MRAVFLAIVFIFYRLILRLSTYLEPPPGMSPLENSWLAPRPTLRFGLVVELVFNLPEPPPGIEPGTPILP